MTLLKSTSLTKVTAAVCSSTLVSVMVSVVVFSTVVVMIFSTVTVEATTLVAVAVVVTVSVVVNTAAKSLYMAILQGDRGTRIAKRRSRRMG